MSRPFMLLYRMPRLSMGSQEKKETETQLIVCGIDKLQEAKKHNVNAAKKKKKKDAKWAQKGIQQPRKAVEFRGLFLPCLISISRQIENF